MLGKKAGIGPYVHSLSNIEDNSTGTGLSNTLSDAINLTVYPIPFTDIAIIHYKLNQQTRMKIEIYNILGEKIKILLDENQSSGSYEMELKAADVNYINGVYYIKVMVDETMMMKKVILMK